MFIWTGAAALGLIAFGMGCRGRSDGGQPLRRTAVLVTIDTWRRDATGFLGDVAPSPTPFIDELASKGRVFSDAVAPVPLTAPSHLSMLTCRWPWQFGLRNNGDVPALGNSPTLAAILKEHGWRTAAFVSASVLDHRFGFGEGFEHYDDLFADARGIGVQAIPERTGDVTVEAALEWARRFTKPGERLFIWLHLFDPHFPYHSHGRPAPDARSAYEAEVRFADGQVKRFYEGLEQLGRDPKEAVWMILADHGEGLGDHGEQTHGFLLHGATTRIPMLIVGTGGHGRSKTLASTVDVTPTLLSALGIAPPQCDGRNLLAPAPDGGRAIPMETVYGARSFGLSEVVGLRTKSWLWEASPADHLWNLAEDPAETTDVAARYSEVIAELRSLREKFALPSKSSQEPIDAELQARLRSLGYLGTAGTATASGSGDARTFVREDEPRFARIMKAEAEGNLDLAEREVRSFLDRYPSAAEVWLEAGFIAVQRGRLYLAEVRFSRAGQLVPGDPRPWLNLGNVRFQARRFADAESAYRRALSNDPQEPLALFNLALVLEQQAKRAEAASTWRRFLALHPSRPEAARARARLARLAGRDS